MNIFNLRVGTKLFATSSYEWHYGEVITLSDSVVVVYDLYGKRYRFEPDGTEVDLRFFVDLSSETRWEICDEETYKRNKERVREILMQEKDTRPVNIPKGVGVYEQLKYKMKYSTPENFEE